MLSRRKVLYWAQKEKKGEIRHVNLIAAEQPGDVRDLRRDRRLRRADLHRISHPRVEGRSCHRDGPDKDEARDRLERDVFGAAEVEPEETASFLTKVYGGSVGLMVSNLVGRGALSEQEIRELKAILDAAEQQED